MMRIKEAILRKKIIQQLNEEWKEYEDEIAEPTTVESPPPVAPDEKQTAAKRPSPVPKQHPLQAFVDELQTKLTVLQKRALKVTWKRLSEAPKTSGRGTIQIMEKMFDKMVELEPQVPSLFYKSAFISCCHDRKHGKIIGNTISTSRDHAHILVEYIDTMLQLMFEGKSDKTMPSPEDIGAYHIRLYPLGFRRHMWQVLGESMAEVMFVQECVRAYPHAASAWSLLAVAFTDKMFGACKPPKDFVLETGTKSGQESPSSDSGCPYSNKSSTRDEHSSSEGTSGVDSCPPYADLHNPSQPRLFARIRPPGLLHPLNLSRDLLTEPPIDYTPSHERPISPPIDYPMDTPEKIVGKKIESDGLGTSYSVYCSEPHLEIDEDTVSKRWPTGQPPPRVQMGNLRYSMVNLYKPESADEPRDMNNLYPYHPSLHSRLTNTHKYSLDERPSDTLRRRHYVRNMERQHRNFRSISPQMRTGALETFL
ncbi:unnamed protein product, partial [Mesorhabditis spiculigera]